MHFESPLSIMYSGVARSLASTFFTLTLLVCSPGCSSRPDDECNTTIESPGTLQDLEFPAFLLEEEIRIEAIEEPISGVVNFLNLSLVNAFSREGTSHHISLSDWSYHWTEVDTKVNLSKEKATIGSVLEILHEQTSTKSAFSKSGWAVIPGDISLDPARYAESDFTNVFIRLATSE